mmetsp:Transcript_14068/g.21937  ORF Transcript_14068/g.21937 Transcript_14068/m.21937 type:complete len:104 (+) Transcript_14068:1340-1651(+)
MDKKFVTAIYKKATGMFKKRVVENNRRKSMINTSAIEPLNNNLESENELEPSVKDPRFDKKLSILAKQPIAKKNESQLKSRQKKSDNSLFHVVKAVRKKDSSS